MELYRTIKERAEAEIVIERSRFIAHISPVGSREEADDFIAQIRSDHRDATHNVPAMVIGEKQQIQWGSDDGEPQGTSGAPMVQMIVSEGLTNLVIVVTRYFGGIKLGTGGLVRAYTSAARAAIEAAGICRVCSMGSLKVAVDYSSFEKIRNMASEAIEEDSASFVIDETEYTDKVTMDLLTHEENVQALEERIKNITNGKMKVEEVSRVVRKMD